MFELGHWPMPAFNSKLYCPSGSAGGADNNCLREVPLSIVVFNPESFTRTIFDNSGDAKNEKYPDLEIQLWKATAYLRREEGCQKMTLGSKGKDCDVPNDYVFVGGSFFLSSPKPTGDAKLMNEIHSERVTGLRFDYLDAYQMNHRITAAGKDLYVPLFWKQQEPAMLKLNEALQFSELKGYGGSLLTTSFICYAIYLSFYFGFCFLFLYGLSCPEFVMDVSNKHKPFAPVYI